MIPCNHNYELGRFMRQEEQSEKMAEEREKLIDDKVEFLMEEGERCDPCGITIYNGRVYYNLFDAFYEMPEEKQKEISKMWREAAQKGDGYINLKANLFDHLDKLVRDYWINKAEDIVRDEIYPN